MSLRISIERLLQPLLKYQVLLGENCNLPVSVINLPLIHISFDNIFRLDMIIYLEPLIFNAKPLYCCPHLLLACFALVNKILESIKQYGECLFCFFVFY
jgi:hypothetical protein